LDKEKSVLIVGRFDPQKRMDRIPEIADAFLSAHPDWSFTVLGDGYLRKEVEAAVAKTSVAERVHFLGHQTDPTPYFRDSAIFASLSDYEGDPLTFLEAKANGLPIVSFELFQNTKLRHDVDGFYIQQGDIKGFAEKLTLLASDRTRRNAMAIEAHKHFLTFNNDTIAQDWLDLFDALIKDAPFNPRHITAPPVATLHREAVHVAKTVTYLMSERIRQIQKRSAPAPLSAPKPKDMPTPVTAPPKLVVSRALAEAKECMEKGLFKQAAKLFAHCASEVPDTANLKRFLAEALLASGQRAEALQQLKLAQKMKPGNSELRRRIRKVSYPRLFFWVPDRPFNG
jgi:tetratricopeptide (TPR) repeat protein